jgi:hypothetical protein
VHLLCLNVITPRLAYMDDDQKLLVVAIDFGSTTAGYAFSFRHEYRRNPLDVSTFIWTTGSHDVATNKAPCTVLLDLEKRFIAFGYDAVNCCKHMCMLSLLAILILICVIAVHMSCFYCHFYPCLYVRPFNHIGIDSIWQYEHKL